MSSTLENYFYAKGLSNSTVKHYHMHTLNFLAWLDKENVEAENVTAVDVTAYMSHLKKKGNANFTRNMQLIILKHFFDYQIEQGHRTNNPAKYLKIRGSHSKKLHPVLSKQELEDLYQQYEIPTAEHPKAKCNWFSSYKLSKQRNKSILGLMIWQGLTTPEINKLTVTDLKLREGKIYITGGRKSAERTLELKSHQIIELLEYQLTTRNELLKYCTSPTDYFYIGTPPSGKKTASGKDSMHIWKRLREEVEKTHPRFINFKQVRASVITHWLSQYNLRQVQYMAGHKHVSTTESYQLGQTEDLQADIDQFHPIY
jgi:site-specific recombinase XerD